MAGQNSVTGFQEIFRIAQMQDIGRMEKSKILVVEDEAPIQELLQFNLERKKYRVKVVDSGEEALTVAGVFLPKKGSARTLRHLWLARSR